MSSVLQKLSARERVLLLATVSIIALAGSFIVVRRALATISQLNAQIDQLEFTLIGLREMEARGRSIEEAFGQVAAHHSSAWTEQEIHDRLRLEIYRLAMQEPPPEDRPEMVRVAGSDFKKLVNIPSLRQGTLREDKEGYREYQLRIVIPDPTPVSNVVEFLRRLQESNHSLRIDGVEMVRPPDGVAVTARVDVTRTVVDSGPRAAGAALLRNAGFEIWSGDGVTPQVWQLEHLQPERMGELVTQGHWALRARSTAANAGIYQEVEVKAGRPYTLSADISVDGPGTFGVGTPEGEALPGAQALEPDGVFYNYVGRFTAPGDEGASVRLRLPLVVIENAGTTLQMDNVAVLEGES